MNTSTNISHQKLRVAHKRVAKKESGIVTNPEVIKAIDDYRLGNTKDKQIVIATNELADFFNKFLPND